MSGVAGRIGTDGQGDVVSATADVILDRRVAPKQVQLSRPSVMRIVVRAMEFYGEATGARAVEHMLREWDIRMDMKEQQAQTNGATSQRAEATGSA